MIRDPHQPMNPWPVTVQPWCECDPEYDSKNPPERVEATTTPEGAKGWVDQAGSAQVLAGGHGLDVAPDASPDGVRAEARREQDGNGGEPSNVPIAALSGAFALYVHVPRSQVWEGSRGRQRGKTHLHVTERFDRGRIHRNPGASLCGRRGWYERSPEYAGEHDDLCPRCVEIAERAAS